MIRYSDGSIRYFTVFEAKKIQTFPDEYVITGSWGEALRQIGNAVPVLLAEKIGAAAMAFLRDQDKPSSTLELGKIEISLGKNVENNSEKQLQLA